MAPDMNDIAGPEELLAAIGDYEIARRRLMAENAALRARIAELEHGTRPEPPAGKVPLADVNGTTIFGEPGASLPTIVGHPARVGDHLLTDDEITRGWVDLDDIGPGAG